MELVPTKRNKNTKFSLEDLIEHKAALKLQLGQQREKINLSSKSLFSIETLTTYLFVTLPSNLSVTDGINMGMKLVKAIRRFFGK